MARSQTARTWWLSASATASEQFMPERSLMYFFILETTIKMSDSSAGVSRTGAGGPDGDGGGGAGGGARTTAGAGAGLGTGAAGAAASARCSASHCTRLGASASTAQASRWRRVATWLSQHGTLQNTSRVRLRL